MERNRILSEINLDTEIFMTSFEKAARLLLEQKEKLEREGWTSLHLKMEHYYDGAELKAYGMRFENDDEFNKRKEDEAKELKKAKSKAERERKKYEELKSKYGEFITAKDEGKYFTVTADNLDEVEKGSTVCLLETYPEDIHLFRDKNGDEVWIYADDVKRIKAKGKK